MSAKPQHYERLAGPVVCFARRYGLVLDIALTVVVATAASYAYDFWIAIH